MNEQREHTVPTRNKPRKKAHERNVAIDASAKSLPVNPV